MVSRHAYTALNAANGFGTMSPSTSIAVKLVLLLSTIVPTICAAPLLHSSLRILEDEEPQAEDPAARWIYLITAMVLVLLGGAFAGLTIGIMGQDEINLQVLAETGEGAQRKHAAQVLKLLSKGKHWVLVTLLLGNVITNETLPLVLDRSIGGGWQAAVASTVLVVIFGEIVPQSICVRFGLPIGSWCSPFVLLLMWLLGPVAWPTAKFLDWVLGEDHGTTYKKSGLKSFVTLHKTLGENPEDRLNQDEVTIITAVLELKEKAVGNIMTPMNDVFTLSADTVLDEVMMDKILRAGYSRIPIHVPDNPRDFVGMLLVKMLITYDPEDASRVRDFSLATLPETSPDTSCLDILNFFQQGKSHMVLVSDYPGEPKGALGVLTLEDVIEELIGEEIVDESDLFVDVHKAIRRLAPAPQFRIPRGASFHVSKPMVVEGDGDMTENEAEDNGIQISRRVSVEGGGTRGSIAEQGASPRQTTFLMRRRSSGVESADGKAMTRQLTSKDPELRRHLTRLGPSNAASNPKQSRVSAVKIKPGVRTIPEGAALARSQSAYPGAYQGGVGEGLLSSAGKDASDGVQALQQGYGTMSNGDGETPKQTKITDFATGPNNDKSGSQLDGSHRDDRPRHNTSQSEDTVMVDRIKSSNNDKKPSLPRNESTRSIESLPSPHSSPRMRRGGVRSGSITEHFVDHGHVKKMVLEATSSSEDPEEGALETHHETDEGHTEGASAGEPAETNGEAKKKKKHRKKRPTKKKGDDKGEGAPLLGGQR